MLDFSLNLYHRLLQTFIKQQYEFVPFNRIHEKNARKTIFLRQDIDAIPQNAIRFAELQNLYNIKSTYFVRFTPSAWDEKMVIQIADLGHEIGYHYENLANTKGRFEAAINDFRLNLEKLRKLVPVNTICMHGSPLSKYDSRILWRDYDYRDFGIVAEPYFDVDFSRVLYLTDTGRRWNGSRVAVRDKLIPIHTIMHEKKQQSMSEQDVFNDWAVKPPVNSALNMTTGASNFQNQFNFHSTSDIISAAESGLLPDKIMLTFHPQRWTSQSLPWLKELIWQNSKNLVKYGLIKTRLR